MKKALALLFVTAATLVGCSEQESPRSQTGSDTNAPSTARGTTTTNEAAGAGVNSTPSTNVPSTNMPSTNAP